METVKNVRRFMESYGFEPITASCLQHTSNVMISDEERGMLTIRSAQLVVLSEAEVEKFEDWMLVHLSQFFARQCAAAGDERLRAMVRYGIKRAAAYRITARSDVAKYIDLMVVFGRDFDTDKRLRWAGEILRKRRNSRVRMYQLLQAAKVSLRRR
jgi:hypothetical protein